MPFADIFNIYEKDLNSRISSKDSVFHNSFHKRLAAILCLRAFLENERQIAEDSKKSRSFSRTSPSSDEFPELLVTHSLSSCSIGMIKILPMCMHLTSSNVQKLALSAPLELWLNDISSINDYHLFKAWSPPPRPPLTKIKLKIDSAKSSSGTSIILHDITCV